MRRDPKPLLFCLMLLLIAAAEVAAQRLPGGTVSGAALPVQAQVPDDLSLPPVVDRTLGRTGNTVDRLSADLAYRAQARLLARRERSRVALAPDGSAIVRHEFLALDAAPTALQAARDAGFSLVRNGAAAADLGIPITLLRDDRQRRPEAALRALRAAMPQADVSFHHLYLPAGAASAAPAVIAASSAAQAAEVRVGLIDSGVDAGALGSAPPRIVRHGCDGNAHPQAHGTQVATRLVDGVRGTLYAADLWCGDAVGSGTLGLIEALGWMAQQRVPVINISLVGPRNAVLERVVQALIARGHVLVAAGGNDGPAAPPLYPAAFPDVIGVGAVDARHRPLPESASGPQIDFCASGLFPRGGPQARGTSFAAPIVARAIAAELRAPAVDAAALAYRSLAASAMPAGKRCGRGLIAPQT